MASHIFDPPAGVPDIPDRFQTMSIASKGDATLPRDKRVCVTCCVGGCLACASMGVCSSVSVAGRTVQRTAVASAQMMPGCLFVRCPAFAAGATQWGEC
jgi:hypothetical protein